MPNDKTMEQTLQRLRRKIEQRPILPPVYWFSEPGDHLGGLLVEIIQVCKEGEETPTPVAVIELPGGEKRSLHLKATVLRRKWEGAKPSLGDVVLVIYKGERPHGSGTGTYPDFDVEVERANHHGAHDS